MTVNPNSNFQDPKGYQKYPLQTPQQQELIQWLMGQIKPNYEQASQAYSSFLKPGADNPITQAANQNFQQQTIPSILNSFGSNSRGSSALNHSLAAGAANLNTNIASQLAPLYLNAASGLGNLATNQTSAATQPQFGYAQKSSGFLKELLLSLLNSAGQTAGSAAGSAVGAKLAAL